MAPLALPPGFKVSLSPYPSLAQTFLASVSPAQVDAWKSLLDDPLPALGSALARWGDSEVPLDVAMARFAKSPEAFGLVHDFPDPWPELARGLPERDACRLERVLMAHRAWQVGQLLGYALSGAAQDDLDAWDEDAGLREQWANDREGYLRVHARKADAIPESWSFGDRPLGLPADLHCFIAPPRHEAGAHAARLGIIALGVSVVPGDWAPHAHRLAESVRLVSGMAGEQMWAGNPNPYHGFQVLPFCCHAGVFCPQGDSSPGWQAWLGEHLAPDELLDLARAPFWTLFAHPQTTPAVLDRLQGLNPHILGCDTLPIYEHLALEIAAGPAPRTRPGWVLDQAHALARALASCDLTSPAPVPVEHGVAWILGTVARLPHHHLKAFPVARRDRLPESERQGLCALADALDRLSKAVLAGPWAGQAAALRTAAAHARSLAG